MQIATYKNFQAYNKLIDILFYVFLTLAIAIIIYIVYTETGSFLAILFALTIIYIISFITCKITKISTAAPTISYIILMVITIAAEYNGILTIVNSEKKYSIMAVVILIGVLIAMVISRKYESQAPIIYRIKDSFLGITHGLKAKKNYNEELHKDTNTLYANHLKFENEKLLKKLEEDYIAQRNDLLNQETEAKNKYDEEKYHLDNLLSKKEEIEHRLTLKNTGAQDYELKTQKEETLKKIYEQNNITEKLLTQTEKIKNYIKELDKTYERDIYYLKTYYKMRYTSYINHIDELLTGTQNKIIKVPYEKINTKGDYGYERTTI